VRQGFVLLHFPLPNEMQESIMNIPKWEVETQIQDIPGFRFEMLRELKMAWTLEVDKK